MPKRIRLIDLSLPLEPVPFDNRMNPKITYTAHVGSAEGVAQTFQCSVEDLPDRQGWAVEWVELSTHSGTHLDATWHYGPTSEGKRAITIDEVPLEYCYSDGVVLDFRHKRPGEGITPEDLQGALKRIKYELKPLDIVLIMTGADKLWGKPEYFTSFPGNTRESTLWLTQEKGIKVTGTDAWGWDRPFEVIAEEFRRTGNRAVIWGGHFAGRVKEYFHIEKMAHLDRLPPFGFKVACFAIPVSRASAGWVRPVAIIEE